VHFEKANVFAIGFDGCIGKVANEGYKANEEVKGNIEQHHHEDASRQTAFHLAHVPNEVQGQGRTCSVTHGWGKANDRGPTKTDAKQGKKSVI
jgi:hypothetical protein